MKFIRPSLPEVSVAWHQEEEAQELGAERKEVQEEKEEVS
jgi:hypothetical protein